MKVDAQVDMLELKEYKDIDLDESPVVALACGHFFTAETLDGTYSSIFHYNSDYCLYWSYQWAPYCFQSIN